MNAKKYAVFALFAATLGWGASFFIVKKATLEVGTWPFLFWRLGLASAFLSLMFPSKVLQVNALTRWRGAILGFLLWAAIATQTIGLQLTTASRSGFLTALYVPLTPVLAWIIFRQALNFRQLAVAAMAVVGLYILTSASPGEMLTISRWLRNANAGDLWTLITALISALHIVLTESFSRREKDSLALGIWQIWGAFICTAVVAAVQISLFKSHHNHLMTSLWNISLWSHFSVFATIFAAVVATCFGFISQVFAQKSIGSFKAALIFALEAPFASGFAYIFTGEVMTLQETIGAVLVFLSSIFPERWLKKENDGPL